MKTVDKVIDVISMQMTTDWSVAMKFMFRGMFSNQFVSFLEDNLNDMGESTKFPGGGYYVLKSLMGLSRHVTSKLAYGDDHDTSDFRTNFLDVYEEYQLFIHLMKLMDENSKLEFIREYDLNAAENIVGGGPVGDRG